MFCENCGANIIENAKICHVCGTTVKSVESAKSAEFAEPTGTAPADAQACSDSVTNMSESHGKYRPLKIILLFTSLLILAGIGIRAALDVDEQGQSMTVVLIISVFAMPLLTMIYNIINARKRGCKGVAAAFGTLGSWLVVIYLCAIFFTFLTPVYQQSAVSVCVLLVCTISFLLFKIGIIKRKKYKFALLDFIPVFLALLLIAINVAAGANYFNMMSQVESALETISGEPLLTKRVELAMAYPNLFTSRERTVRLSNAITTSINDKPPSLSGYDKHSAEAFVSLEQTYKVLPIRSTLGTQYLSELENLYYDKLLTKIKEISPYFHYGSGSVALSKSAALPVELTRDEEIAGYCEDIILNADNEMRKCIIIFNEGDADSSWELAVGQMLISIPPDLLPETPDEINTIIACSRKTRYVGFYLGRDGSANAYDETLSIDVYEADNNSAAGGVTSTNLYNAFIEAPKQKRSNDVYIPILARKDFIDVIQEYIDTLYAKQ